MDYHCHGERKKTKMGENRKTHVHAINASDRMRKNIP